MTKFIFHGWKDGVAENIYLLTPLAVDSFRAESGEGFGRTTRCPVCKDNNVNPQNKNESEVYLSWMDRWSGRKHILTDRPKRFPSGDWWWNDDKPNYEEAESGGENTFSYHRNSLDLVQSSQAWMDELLS